MQVGNKAKNFNFFFKNIQYLFRIYVYVCKLKKFFRKQK